MKLLDPLLPHINYMYLCRDYVRYTYFTIFSGLYSTPFSLCPVFLLFFFPAFFPASKQKFKVRLQSYGTWVRKKLIVSLAQEMN